jgi:formiminoglutamase
MSPPSSSVAGWFSRLEPVPPPEGLPRRPDDPRLGEVVEFWDGHPASLRKGRAVIVGFPQDEGVRRNHGRPGAAEAPERIRHWLYRLTTCDFDGDLALHPPIDAGNIRVVGTLEESQQALGEVVAGLLAAGAIPVVLGGGHETAFGHFLGYAHSNTRCGIINLDAHLDVRPYTDGGNSGTPFRQALEHPSKALAGYVCLGAQAGSVSRAHVEYVEQQGGKIGWDWKVGQSLVSRFFWPELQRLAGLGAKVYVSLDADVVSAAEVPGVSAPNPLGLSGIEVAQCVRLAGLSPEVASFDLVEINPRIDRDEQSCRWAARVIWHFLIGVALRGVAPSSGS